MTEQQMAELIRKVDETHDAVIKLQTLFNGGPGHWPPCITSVEKASDHEKRLRALEQAAWKLAGTSSVIAAILALAGQYILKHL